jgi:integrase
MDTGERNRRAAVPTQLLTEDVIRSAKPRGSRDAVLSDARIPGYQLKATVGGKRVLSLLYWSPVEKGKRRRYTIGEVGQPVRMPSGQTVTLTATTGRKLAESIRGQVKAGRDPFLDLKDRAREQESAEVTRRARAAAERPLRDVALAFLADAEDRQLSEKTRREWKRLLQKHVLPVIGNVAVSKVGKEDAMAVKRAMPRGRHVLANRVQQVACSLLNFAEDERGALPNPFAVGLRGRNRWYKEEMTREPITRDELARIFAALDAEQDVDRGGAVDAIRFLALTGWRKGEALALRWDAVDFAQGSALLVRTKTGSSLRALSPHALTLLQEIPERGPYVFPSPDAPDRPRQEVKRMWLRARAAAGVSKPLHALRHGAATIALSEGVPLATVGALLGHRNPATTLRYAKTELEKAKDAAAVLGDAVIKATRPANVTPITRKAKHR